jgi:DNA-binding NtrC family response regulator
LGSPVQLRILLADDEKTIRVTLGDDLRAAGHEVCDVGHGDDALSALDSGRFDLVITDIRMPGADGITVLKKAKDVDPATEVIVITGFGTVESAVGAMRQGAYNYILKPFLNSDILLSVERIAQVRQLRDDNRRLKDELDRMAGTRNVIGNAPAMREILKVVRNVAGSNASILIEGESGTGKEVIARAIHANSERSQKAFVAVSCGALPESLLETELFGHEKGAFTDARKERKGRFELASGGTIFLDDIDDIPLPFQVKLLRALQEREIVRVGGERTIKVDIRVISATKKDLTLLMKEQRFREDLYYRLNVVPVVLPPLRDRKEDVPLLVHHFIKLHAEKGREYDVKPEVMDALMRYSWAGNVRELENSVERAIVLAGGARFLKKEHLLKLSDRFKSVPEVWTQEATLKEAVMREERRHIIEVLKHTGGHRAQTAMILGISRKSLWEKLRDYNIEA